MSRELKDMMILYTPSTEDFVRKVLEHFKPFLEERYREKFPIDNTGLIELHFHWNKEVEPLVIPTVRKRDVYVFHSFCGYDGISYDPNIGFMALYLIDATLRGMSPDEITYILPHMPYQRQDFTDRPHVPISAVRTARMITDYDPLPITTRIVTLDPHAKQYQGFAKAAFDPLRAMPLHEEYVRENRLQENSVVVSADAGALNNARNFATRLNAPIVVGNKIRSKPSEVEFYEISGEEYVRGRRCLVYEDMIDTFSTGGLVTRALRDAGATEVYLLATHGIFSATDKGRAEGRIRESQTKIVVTNSIPYPPQYLKENKDWLTVLGLEAMIAELLYKVQRGESVSSLYENH